MNWIEIEKEQPPFSIDLLLYIYSNRYNLYFIEIGKLNEYGWKDFNGEKLLDCDSKITHWMHLPDPPIKES